MRNLKERLLCRNLTRFRVGETLQSFGIRSLDLPILAKRRRAKRGPINCPVQSANQASTTHNVAESDGNEIMNDASYRNWRGVEICRNVTRLDQYPDQHQNIHVLNTL